MADREMIPNKALRELDMLILHNKHLQNDKELQLNIINWAEQMLSEARAEWEEIRAATIEAVILSDPKAEAKRRAIIKDEKYAPFREYFKNLQRKKFYEFQKQGKTLTANSFVRYFLKNQSSFMDIPYKNSNLQNKLNQLAQANNREFKKASA